MLAGIEGYIRQQEVVERARRIEQCGECHDEQVARRYRCGDGELNGFKVRDFDAGHRWTSGSSRKAAAGRLRKIWVGQWTSASG